MARQFEVGGKTYEFPDDFSNEKVQGILSKQGIIKAPKQEESFGSKALTVGKDFLRGAGAEGINFVFQGGDLLRRSVLPGKRIIDTPEVKALTTGPNSLAGKIGREGTKLAEYSIPVPGAAALKGVKAAGKLGLAAKAGGEALQIGGVEAVRSGGDKKEIAKSAALGAVFPIAAEGLKKLSPTVKAAAERMYARILAPGGKIDKLETREAVPELLKQGFMAATEGGFSRKVQSNLQEWGVSVDKAIDEYITSGAYHAQSPSIKGVINMAPPGTVDMRPIIRRMASDIREKFFKSGSIPSGMETEYKNYVSVLDDLKNRAVRGKGFVPLAQVRELRKAWDGQVASVGGYHKPDIANMREAQRAGANAIRGHLADYVPGLKEANSHYSFWSGVNDVLENTADRRVGHGVGLSSTVAKAGSIAGGMISGHPTEGIEAYLLLGAMDHVMRTPGFKGLTSIGMDRLATQMSNGKAGDAIKYLSLLTRDSTPEPKEAK